MWGTRRVHAQLRKIGALESENHFHLTLDEPRVGSAIAAGSAGRSRGGLGETRNGGSAAQPDDAPAGDHNGTTMRAAPSARPYL